MDFFTLLFIDYYWLLFNRLLTSADADGDRVPGGSEAWRMSSALHRRRRHGAHDADVNVPQGEHATEQTGRRHVILPIIHLYSLIVNMTNNKRVPLMYIASVDKEISYHVTNQ